MEIVVFMYLLLTKHSLDLELEGGGELGQYMYIKYKKCT